jgi:hypothetical protein
LLCNTKIYLTGWTPLHLACRLRQTRCIYALAEHGLIDRPDAKDSFGLSVFDYAYGYTDTWLAMIRSFPGFVPSRMPHKSEMLSMWQRDGRRQVCRIVAWRLEQISKGGGQFDEADARLCGLAIMDCFLKVGDNKNALSAVEIYIGQPSTRLSPRLNCQFCLGNKKQKFYVCRSCSFRLLCEKCKDKSQKQNLKCCFRHNFLTAPLDSWFRRDATYATSDDQTEKQSSIS